MLFPKVEILRDKSELLTPKEFLAIDTETTGDSIKMDYTPLLDKIVLVTISDGERRQVVSPEMLPVVKGLLEDPQIPKVFHNAKYDLHVLANHGYFLKGPIWDTMVMAWLICVNDKFSLDAVAEQYLGEGKKSYAKIFSPKNPFLSDLELSFEYASRDAFLTATVFPILRDKLKSFPWILKEGKTLWDYYCEIESKFTLVLFNMERRGIKVDVQYLVELGKTLNEKISQIEEEINAAAGRPINLRSHQQLAKFLFNDLGIVSSAKTPGGKFLSTNEDVLKDLASKGYKLVDRILEHRKLSKLLSTYVTGLIEKVNLTGGRLYPTFNQTNARTGRLSASNPNTQNFPKQKDQYKIRSAFIADKDKCLIDADLSQAEVRLIAHISGDPALIKSVMQKDVYTAIGSEVFGVPPDKITKAMRERIKRLVLATNYGMSAKRLAVELTEGGIPTTSAEAENLLDRYFKVFPLLHKYIENIPYIVKQNGGKFYTLLGRHRDIMELFSSSFNTKAEGERQAVNTGPQAGVADVLRMSMISLESDQELSEYGVRMLLQIHDELLFEAPCDKVTDKVLDRIKHIMTNSLEQVGINLTVPLNVDIQKIYRWSDRK